MTSGVITQLITEQIVLWGIFVGLCVLAWQGDRIVQRLDMILKAIQATRAAAQEGKQ